MKKNNLFKTSNGVNNQFKKVAIEAAKKAGKVLLREYANFDRAKIKLKSRHEILTKADLTAEKIIIRAIKKYFPDHQILSEEAGQTNPTPFRQNKKTYHKSAEYFKRCGTDYLWIVDPLDGTTNFSMHNPLWSVSIALAHKDKIILGVIFIPVLGELYWAEKNKGAYLNNKKIKVSKISSGKVLNTFCHSHREKDIKKALAYHTKQKLSGLDCRQLGSAAIELAYVACGRVETIVIPGANSWDVAAGVLLVREAGGKVTDFSGKEWNLKSKYIAASNGKVHKQILKVLKKI
ncbi:MAG: inositol monophosphatase family protein [Patescibacteria group bacterium]|nr:inositol monophosphatase family protein [Patescibacteria group bacterium]MDD5294390.1 inositol monophosphatase family protein [Patescibacteria group bacterium]MDD5554663.1 inositol monophosphatase family protein [Patescibacteria group bacterium]